jgi:NAD(P) transhydrogenase subunit alpha
MRLPEFSTKYLVLSTKYSQSLLAFGAVLFMTSPLLADPSAAAKPPATSSDLPTMLFIFMLASFIGLGVITRVSRLLHTPLMSLTNAISAIAVVGAITVAGADHPLPITLLGAIALFASTTNIVSGFLITDRMLKMFKRQEATKA